MLVVNRRMATRLEPTTILRTPVTNLVVQKSRTRSRSRTRCQNLKVSNDNDNDSITSFPLCGSSPVNDHE